MITEISGKMFLFSVLDLPFPSCVCPDCKFPGIGTSLSYTLLQHLASCALILRPEKKPMPSAVAQLSQPRNGSAADPCLTPLMPPGREQTPSHTWLCCNKLGKGTQGRQSLNEKGWVFFFHFLLLWIFSLPNCVLSLMNRTHQQFSIVSRKSFGVFLLVFFPLDSNSS